MNNIYRKLLNRAPIGYLILEGFGSLGERIVYDHNSLLLDFLSISDDIKGRKVGDAFNRSLVDQLEEVVLFAEDEGEVEGMIFSDNYKFNVRGVDLAEGFLAIMFSERAGYLEHYKKSEQTRLSLLENLPGMVYRCKNDESWTMEYVSEGCKDLTGYEVDSLLGNRDISYNEIIMEKYRKGLKAQWDEAIITGNMARSEYQIMTAGGEIKWVYEQGQPVFDKEGQLMVLEGMIVDISQQKEREEKINYLTYYDAMTGVYNRRYYNNTIMELDSVEALPLSVIVGDINGLKLINDAFGHDYGDQLIMKTAELLKDSVRSTDVLSRTGGDEFVILLPNTNLEVVEKIVDRIGTQSNLINQMNVDSPVQVSISLGFATRDSMDEKLEDVIKLAEDHMYKNKLFDHKSTHSTIIKSIRDSLMRRGEEHEDNMTLMEKVARSMGQKLEFNEDITDKLLTLVSIHDIGKIAIDTELLNKEGPLTKEEWETIRKHPEMGYRIAMASMELAAISDYILSHHERWDGKGYPDGLKYNEIPKLSRIVSIMDSFDAMITDKPYRRKVSKEEALEEISKNSGTQFDPELAQLFIETVKKICT